MEISTLLYHHRHLLKKLLPKKAVETRAVEEDAAQKAPAVPFEEESKKEEKPRVAEKLEELKVESNIKKVQESKNEKMNNQVCEVDRI